MKAKTSIRKSRKEYTACGTIYKDRFFLLLQLNGNGGSKILIQDRGKRNLVI